MIYLLTAIGLSPGGSSRVHIYTQTIHRTAQNKQYIEQHNNHKEKYIFCVYAYSLSYPAYTAHAVYYTVTCGLLESTIYFLHY